VSLRVKASSEAEARLLMAAADELRRTKFFPPEVTAADDPVTATRDFMAWILVAMAAEWRP
jgi:hypothetical protein